MQPANTKNARFEGFKQLRLAIHYHIEANVSAGGIYYPAYYGKWVDSLAPFFREVVLVTHTTNTRDGMDYRLKSENVSVCDLGAKPSLLRRVIDRRKYAEVIADKASEWDIVGFRCPTPLAIHFYPKVQNKQVFFLLVGNIVGTTRMSSITTWKKWALLTYWIYDKWRLSRHSRRRPVFAIGPHFTVEYPKMRDIQQLHTSTITEHDIKGRVDCCDSATTELVCVGRLSPEKGMDTAIEAIALLKAAGISVRLRIASLDLGGEYERLKQLTSDLDVEQEVEFLGFVPHGPEMEELLDTSDLLLIPSRWDAQTRAIFEGMARGLPVIASRGVKSLPQVYTHKEDIYFVDPESPNQISDAVTEIRGDQALRQGMISSSLRIASEKTLGSSAELLLTGLLQYMEPETPLKKAQN